MEQVSYTFHLKMSKNYNSGGIDLTYTSDVKDDETPDEAYQRVKNFVEAKVAEKYDSLKEIYG